MADVELDLGACVLTWRGGGIAPEVGTFVRGRELFRGQTELGRTEHVVVFSDGTANGDAAGRAVLQTAEADYLAVKEWFGGIDLPPGQEGDDQTVARTALPIQVLIDQQAGGAYHFGCDATDIYIEPDPALANGFMVAELVEVFEPALGNGWECGNSNGEALSRVLAGERNGNLGRLFVQTGQFWWRSGHGDYVNSNQADDRDEASNGCGTLFLLYLHTQLGYSWRDIVAAGGATMGATYQKLTGKTGQQGFQEFVALLESVTQAGQLNIPPSGNPFPIAATTPEPTPQPPTQDPTPQPPQEQPTLPSLPEVVASGNGLRTFLIIAAVVVFILLVLVGGYGVSTGAIHF